MRRRSRRGCECECVIVRRVSGGSIGGVGEVRETYWEGEGYRGINGYYQQLH